MKNINLAMALKIKSRLIGEINKLKLELGTGQTKRFTMHNNNPVGLAETELLNWRNTYTKKLEKYDELMKKLITLKAKIQTANVKSGALLVSLEEMKTNLQFINQLHDNLSQFGENGQSDEYAGTTGKDNEINVTRRTVTVVDPSELAMEAKTMQDIVNNLQDELDAFNASTTIEWDDGTVG